MLFGFKEQQQWQTPWVSNMSTVHSEIFRTQKHSWKQQFGDYMFKLFRPQLVIVGPHFSSLLILTSVCSWTVLKPAEITLCSWEVWSLDPTRLRQRHWQPETSQPGCMRDMHTCILGALQFTFLWMNPQGHKKHQAHDQHRPVWWCRSDPSTAGCRTDSTITFI